MVRTINYVINSQKMYAESTYLIKVHKEDLKYLNRDACHLRPQVFVILIIGVCVCMSESVCSNQ